MMSDTNIEEYNEASLIAAQGSNMTLPAKKSFKFLKFIILAVLGVGVFYLIFAIAKDITHRKKSEDHQHVLEILKNLNTDYIDLYHMHGFDANTPVEETLSTLDELIRSGKIRQIAASNFSGWHLMKSLSISEKHQWQKYVAHQVYYSLANREYEWELMPLGLDQHVSAIVWSPLSSGRLSGKFSRKNPAPAGTRVSKGGSPVPNNVIDENILFNIVDVLEEIAADLQKTVSQVALNWVLQRPGVASVIIGARTEEQLRENLGAAGWNLSYDQVKKLDAASDTAPVYP
ncbi:MAG: aldo/keto reductase, partial [Sphingobacteriaceae bacterium]